jgi:hypothetical protein
MKRAIALIWLTVSAMVVSVRPAQADFWDWLQEFSGPGPFGTGQTLNTMVPCPEKFRDSRQSLAFDPDNPLTCFFFDHRSFDNTHQPDNFGIKNPGDPGVGKVSLHFYEVGFSRRMHPAVELGFGGGFMSIASRGETKYKPVITLSRVVVTPAMLFRSPSYWNTNPSRLKHVLKIVKFYGRLNIIAGELDAADFGLSPSESDFKTNMERVASAGFIFDAHEIYRAIVDR